MDSSSEDEHIDQTTENTLSRSEERRRNDRERKASKRSLETPEQREVRLS